VLSQLELPGFGEGRLREAIEWLFSYEMDGVKKVTIEQDYRVRSDWLLRRLGDCPLEELVGKRGYEKLRQLVADEKGKGEEGLKMVTLKKRLDFLLRVLGIAANRELVDRARIPELPNIMMDGVKKEAFHTLPQYRLFRAALPSIRHRMLIDLGFWTGMRSSDLYRTRKRDCDPHKEFLDEHGRVISVGMFLLRNHKRREDGFTPYWVPMDPEFRRAVLDFYEAVPMSLDDRITGKFGRPSAWMDPASIRAGVPRLTIHSLRHCRHTYLESIGVQLEDIRYALGAAGTTVMKKHYLHPTPSTLKRLNPNAVPPMLRQDFDEPPRGNV
jgi:integrase